MYLYMIGEVVLGITWYYLTYKNIEVLPAHGQ